MANLDLVRPGYDRIAKLYAERRNQESSLSFLDLLDARLGRNSLVLDLGCGAGLPVDRYLVDRGHRVIGLDLSAAMIELARQNVPEAHYELGDMAAMSAGAFGVDAIVSFFAIIHVERKSHRGLFRLMRSFLQPGGWILVTTGGADWEGEEDFFGVAMAWSHYDRQTYRNLIEETGFAIHHEAMHAGNSAGDDDWHPLFLAEAV